ncbi:transposase [Chryseobacterium nematophagum]|uniref:Transposase n=1 Tax=Chryseobacterium nematophagum TaxID=2305228 RepID=A0A3M7TFQ6_9FLAO|nr:transposase [Chryseobacterium nematophagum]RNA61737.1 transposase [Chryseobacterium nematophagum]
MVRNTFNFKNIHLGSLIKKKVDEDQIELSFICDFFSCRESEIKKMYELETLDTEILLSWCRLLKYDFFRIYSEHLILYAPPNGIKNRSVSERLKISKRIQFRKNIYTKEMIDFILEIIYTGEKDLIQVMTDYGIPKSTLFKWLDKYSTK